MELFKARKQSITDADFKAALKPFQLAGKCVLCHSRLFSLGRITKEETVTRMIEILQEEIGPEGTLCIPVYTMSAYNKEVFDVRNSRCPTGILGEIARKMPGFKRSIHPVYSTCCWGKQADYLVSNQSPNTCFGKDSFFDLFDQQPNAYFLMLGINLSVLTMCHYYDQKNAAEGRMIKEFDADIIDYDGKQSAIKFESYVKDYDFYEGKHTCLARLDAVLTKLNLITRTEFAANWIHGIAVKQFAKAYETCLKQDQLHYLIGSIDEFTEYYRKDNFQMYHNQLDVEKFDLIKKDIVD